MQKKIFFPIVVLAFMGGLMTACKKSNSFSHNSSSPVIVDSFTPSLGSGATEVLISGSNFSTDTAAISVTINGNPLKVVSANGSQIMAIVPKKAGSGPIVVTIGGGSGKSVDTFTYLFTRTVTTLAGNGSSGYANGNGADAQFHFSDPVNAWYRSMGIITDDNLNVYIADPGNHCIRKIDTAGNVTTLAGNPNTADNIDGQGTGAAFSLPYDLAIDASGNLYTVDPGTTNIRKITPGGLVTTLAPAAYEPWSIAVEKKSGAIYYSSSSGGTVYALAADGSSSTILSGLNAPGGIKFDADGNLYVAVSGDHVIQKFAAGTWSSSVIAGTAGKAGFQNGSGAAALLGYPWGLAIDAAGDIYVGENGTWNGGTDSPDESVRYITAGNWNVSTFAGGATAGYNDGIGTAAVFSAPIGVAVDKNGTVYVMDKNNNVVRKIVSE